MASFNQPIRHVSLDVWLTVIRSHPAFKRKRASLMREHFALSATVDEVLSRIRHFDVAATRINEIVGKNIDARELVGIILHDLGLDLKGVSHQHMMAFFTELRELVLAFPPKLMDPEIPAAIEACRSAGITVSLLSNTGFVIGQVLDEVMAHHGILELLNFRTYSDEIGFSKPSSAAFKAVIDSVQTLYTTPAETILHIGDNPVADLQGAQTNGLQGHWLRNDQETLPQVLKTLLPH